jgi:hypothetical protein
MASRPAHAPAGAIPSSRPHPFHAIPPLSPPPPGSWDALGVHFLSADSSGSWADNEIIELVKAHNAKA